MESRQKGKSVSRGIVVPLAWVLWGVLFIVLVVGLVRVATERTTSPESSRGIGVLVIGALLVVLVGLGALLYLAERKGSSSGIITIAVIVGWPVALLVLSPAVKAFKDRSFAASEARSGDFRDPRLDAMARAIVGDDTTALRQLLGGQAPPSGKDRAGNDLLAFALLNLRDRRGAVDPVRVLLDAGADPRQSRMGSGEELLVFTILGITPEQRETARLLLDHGADPNAYDPQREQTALGIAIEDFETLRLLVERGADINALQFNGTTPLINSISGQHWDCALYLVERGANLDIRNPDGLSVDYYLNDWKDSIFGNPLPEGWLRVREAIAARRARG